MEQSVEAKLIWEDIPANVRLKLLNNFWCHKCKDLVGVNLEEMSIDNDFMLMGECLNCEETIFQFLEISNKHRRVLGDKCPYNIVDFSNPDISKILRYKKGSSFLKKLDFDQQMNFSKVNSYEIDNLLNSDKDQEYECDIYNEIIKKGPRPIWSFPREISFNDNIPYSELVDEGIDLMNEGQWGNAINHMNNIIKKNPLCLDAYSHLGIWYFEDGQLDVSLRHFKMGTAMAFKLIGDKSEGVFLWSTIDNRPFLRCLHGLGLVLYRKNKIKEAIEVFKKLVWINPLDHLGCRYMLNQIEDGLTWEEGQEDLEDSF